LASFLAIASVSLPASAGTVGLHIASYHDAPGFNNTNPGLYVKLDNGVVIGGYHNSLRRQSLYAGKHYSLYESGAMELGLTVGLVGGYHGNKYSIADGIVPLPAHVKIVVA
jgi:hypothetical protein